MVVYQVTLQLCIFFFLEREREFESYYLASDLIRDFERGILSRRNLMTALLYGLFLNDLQ